MVDFSSASSSPRGVMARWVAWSSRGAAARAEKVSISGVDARNKHTSQATTRVVGVSLSIITARLLRIKAGSEYQGVATHDHSCLRPYSARKIALWQSYDDATRGWEACRALSPLRLSNLAGGKVLGASHLVDGPS